MMNILDGHAAKRQRTNYEEKNGFNAGGANMNNYTKGGGKPRYEDKPNHILLITVINPTYPITTEVVHTICSPSGNVLRIVIFKKNGVQAMVEFDNLESAQRAKQSLSGCDIYAGCCTLKIEYAKPTKLNVYKNDNDSWDYTNPNISKPIVPSNERPALLKEPPRGYGPPGAYDGVRGPQAGPGPAYDGYDNSYLPPREAYGPPMRDPYAAAPPLDRYPRDPYGRDGPQPMQPHGMPGYGPAGQMAPPPPGSMGQQGLVMMVYGLCHQKMNADKLFNIFCLYGNVVRVKFLKSKEGCAMIQMADPMAIERAMTNLNGVSFFGSKLQLGYSKQPFLNAAQQPFDLPDGTQSFKDFSSNRNNRFSTAEAANKNRILPPSKLLHYFNAPVGFTEEEMLELFNDDKNIQPPSSIKIFTSKKPNEKSSSGLLEFETVSDALEALAFMNHISIPNPNGKFPYTFKLCFSTSAARGGGRGGGNY